MCDPVALAPPATRPAPPVPPAAPPVRAARSGAKHPLVLCGFGATALVAMGFLAAGLPAISVCMLAVSGISSFVLGSALDLAGEPRDRRPRRVAPEDIVAGELRATYRAILLALGEVERALADAPGLRAPLLPVLERCRAAVELTGRIATLANPLQRHLDMHDAALVRSALARLRARAGCASDDAAADAWSQAAAARVRQLATLDQIAAKRDQICARLELVHAALESFAAAIVRLHTLDEEQILLAGESVTGQLDAIGDDLAILEAALE